MLLSTGAGKTHKVGQTEIPIAPSQEKGWIAQQRILLIVLAFMYLLVVGTG